MHEGARASTRCPDDGHAYPFAVKVATGRASSANGGLTRPFISDRTRDARVHHRHAAPAAARPAGGGHLRRHDRLSMAANAPSRGFRGSRGECAAWKVRR